MPKATGYRPKLSQLMRIYERNYRLLTPLLRSLQQIDDSVRYEVRGIAYRLVLLSQTRYTSIVSVTQEGDTPPFEEGVMPLAVRLYHDAKVAEVCSVPQGGALKPKYDYPNPHMHQQDEKWQLNCFLNDWLRHGLRHGFQVMPLCE